MKSFFILLAAGGLAAVQINFNDIMKDSSTKGWGVGFGSLFFIVFGSLAIWIGA
jgi:hypothetical protein